MNLNQFTANGKFLMLALDHRGSIKKLINPENPDSVSDEQVISLKNEIIEALRDQFSALLIDETWGFEACHEICQYKPFLLPVEKSGYMQDREQKVTELEYSVKQLMDMGASGAKLLVYFNPNVESAEKQIETTRKVMEECKENDFPFFLEIVTYTPSENTSDTPGVSANGSSEPHTGSEQDISGGNLVIESVKKFIDSDVVPDVWKLEYPGSVEQSREITNLVGSTPWILLTGGHDFETFKSNLGNAVKAEASGFLAGRALWQEVCKLDGEEKEKFLNETLPERFKTIAEIATKF